MRKLLLIALAALFLCTGCTSRQLEEQLLVIILGVDQLEDRAIRVCAKVPSNAAGDASSGGSSASQGDAGEQMGYFVLEATGHSFSDAMELLSATTPRTLNFSQVREVVLGSETADDAAFGDLIESIYTVPRMRPSAALVICQGEAKKFVEAQKPYVGIRLSRYIETTLMNYAGKGFVPTTSLGEALRDLRYGFRDPLLIYGAVNAFQHERPDGGNHSLDVPAGSLSRKSVNPVELLGAAATDGVSVSGTLTGYEMALIHLAKGDVQSLVLQTEAGPMPIFARAPAALRVEETENGLCLCLSMLCEAHYTAGLSPRTEEMEALLERDMRAMLAHLQALRCDGMGFGNIAVRGCLSLSDWEKLPWRERYEQAETEVHIRVQLRKN